MGKFRFIQILASDSRDYNNRTLLTNTILENKGWLTILLDNMGVVNNKNSHFSVRIFELVCKKDLSILLPYLDRFVEIIPTLKLDGSIRSSAKIIELLTVEYFIKYNPMYTRNLNIKHLEQFTETCFDWMITDKPTATQAHSMYSLYLLGTKFDWIHSELVENIEQNLPSGSTGYINRGRKILKAVHTKSILKLY